VHKASTMVKGTFATSVRVVQSYLIYVLLPLSPSVKVCHEANGALPIFEALDLRRKNKDRCKTVTWRLCAGLAVTSFYDTSPWIPAGHRCSPFWLSNYCLMQIGGWPSWQSAVMLPFGLGMTYLAISLLFDNRMHVPRQS
jgi:hypothetical protein